MLRQLFLAGLAAILIATLPLSGPALAHAIVLESRPAAKETIAGPDLDFFLRFNSRIDKQRSRLSLMLPDGSTRPLTVEAEGGPDQLFARTTGLPPGEYLLRWQVLALDGHITRGNIPFTVSGP